MRPDFTFYIDDEQMLLRPENTRARSHLEKNETEYGKWLVWFYFGNGSSILLPKEDTDAFFVRPGRDIGPLADALVKRGFTVVKDDKERPPFARLMLGDGSKRPWLLHLRNYMIPAKIGKFISKGAGTPN